MPRVRALGLGVVTQFCGAPLIDHVGWYNAAPRPAVILRILRITAGSAAQDERFQGGHVGHDAEASCRK